MDSDQNKRKTGKLYFFQSPVMKLKELNAINSDNLFVESRLIFQKKLLTGLTIGSIIIIGLWQFLDNNNNAEHYNELLWLYVITFCIYAVNILIAHIRSTPKANKQHLVAVFYIGTIFCTFLGIFTGGSGSLYWYGLFFILITWFLVTPFNYREIIIHGALFIVFFLTGLLSQHALVLDNSAMTRIIILYTGTFFIGCFSAVNRNRAEAIGYQSELSVKEANEELRKSNEKLIAEIKQHSVTTQILIEKQKFLDDILTNAPLVIWSIDMEGVFTYSQYKGAWGIEPESRVGNSALEVYKGTEVETFLHKVLKDKIQNDIVQVNGIYYDTRITPLFNNNKEKIGYLGISLDITEHIRKETELRKYKLILDQTPAAVFIVDKNSNFEYINPFFTMISGYTREDLLYQNINEKLYQGQVPESRKGIFESLKAGKTWQGELQTRNKNGNTYWANTIATPFIDEQGLPDGYIVIQQDITEQKKMLNALKEREQLHRTLIEDSLEGVVITQDFNFTFMNKVFCNMMGYTMEELMGMEPTYILAPEDRERVISYHSKRMQGEEVPHIYVADFIRKDGSRFTAEINSAGVELNGKSASYITMRDITEKNRMEVALRLSEEKYRRLFEAESDAIFLIDLKDGRIIEANPAASTIYGYTHDELVKLRNIDLSAEPEKTAKATEERQRVVPIRYHQKKNGTVFPVELSAGFTEFEGRDVEIITSRDISERIKMQEALSESEKKYRELTEMLPQTVFELDLNANISYFNQTGYKQFGLEKSDLGRAVFNFIDPDQHEYMKSNIQKTIKEKQYSFGNKYTAVRKNGDTFPAMTFAGPMISESVVTGIRGIILDMTDHEKMENALRESEFKYKTLVESSQDGICVTQDGKFKLVNNTLCTMLGYNPEELYKIPAIEIIEPSFRKQIVDLNKSREQGAVVETSFSLQLIRKDKSIIDVSVESSNTEFEGKSASFDTLHDITESKRMQAALIESEVKYRELVEKTNSIILKWDNEFHITFLNEYGLQFFGYSKEEIINKPMVGTIVPKTEQNSGRNLKELMKLIFTTPEKYSQNINENMCKNGERVWVSWNNTAMRDENGQITNMFSVGTDITERRKNEEELRITKEKLQKLNQNLEKQVDETAKKLTEVNTQLIRLQKENLQSQFEVLRQQVNPHFLFNSLNVLTSLIKLEPDLAEKFTEHLSKVYRYVLENKDNDLVSLYTELDFLDAYLFLLNIRFMDKIKVDIDIDEDKKDFLILPLALQLIIENAIKHNTMSKKAPLTIQLFIDKNLMLNIVNNLQERESNMISTGVGLKNITHRYELLELPAPEFYKTETQFVAKIPLKINNE
jgi:PAS domain S-box-containing protein